jgi:DnaJ family protein C protein 7
MLHAPRPQAKSYDAAIADCSACLELDPSYFKAYRTRARAHLALEDYDSSLRDFKQAYELAPSGSSDEAALKREVREAEATLKKSKMKDHYKVLGIEASATEVEIKKAYRKMSLVHHPDKGGDEAVFKEVSSLPYSGFSGLGYPLFVSLAEPCTCTAHAFP